MGKTMNQISNVSLKSVTHVQPKELIAPKNQKIEIVCEKTLKLQELEGIFQAKSSYIIGLQTLGTTLQYQMQNAQNGKEEALIKKEINDINKHIEYAKLELENIKTQIQNLQNEASQDEKTKNSIQEGQVFYNQAMAAKPIQLKNQQ